MPQRKSSIFSSNPEENSHSFQSFLALSNQESTILNCIKKHIFPLIDEGICEILNTRTSNGSPFRVLSVGSGEGQNDINILKALIDNKRRVDGEAIAVMNRVIEPHLGRLDRFCSKAENLYEHFEGRATIDFEWIPTTFQEYTSQKKAHDVTFDLIHFTHSIYYVGVEEALVHCYEKELGKAGVILSIAQAEDDPMLKFARKFPEQRSPSFPRNKDVVSVAIKRGWKYFACPGDSNSLDITTIFDSSSRGGNFLLDFLTNRVQLRQNEGMETVRKILKFWKQQSYVNEDGRRIVDIRDHAVIILKGFDH